jgi:hypothetical protein
MLRVLVVPGFVDVKGETDSLRGDVFEKTLLKNSTGE